MTDDAVLDDAVLRPWLLRVLRTDRDVRTLFEGKGNQIARVTSLSPLQVRIYGESSSVKVQWVAAEYTPANGDDVEVSRVRGELSVIGQRVVAS